MTSAVDHRASGTLFAAHAYEVSLSMYEVRSRHITYTYKVSGGSGVVLVVKKKIP